MGWGLWSGSVPQNLRDVECGAWRNILGMWNVVCGVWPVRKILGMWNVEYGVWFERLDAGPVQCHLWGMGLFCVPGTLLWDPGNVECDLGISKCVPRSVKRVGRVVECELWAMI